jgi:hypothetical protein
MNLSFCRQVGEIVQSGRGDAGRESHGVAVARSTERPCLGNDAAAINTLS